MPTLFSRTEMNPMADKDPERQKLEIKAVLDEMKNYLLEESETASWRREDGDEDEE